jgi:hypothetical protein
VIPLKDLGWYARINILGGISECFRQLKEKIGG